MNITIINNNTLTIADLTEAEKVTYQLFIGAACKMTPEQALLALQSQRNAVSTATAKTVASKKKLPEFEKPIFEFLKNCFVVDYKPTKTELGAREKQLKTDIGLEAKAEAKAEEELKTINELPVPSGKTAAKVQKEREAKVQELELAISCYKSNLETFSIGLQKVEKLLKTATDSWEYTLPELAKPTYDDILAYFNHRETLMKRNSGRDSESANKSQKRPDYNLEVSKLFSDKVADFLNIAVPAKVVEPTTTEPTTTEPTTTEPTTTEPTTTEGGK